MGDIADYYYDYDEVVEELQNINKSTKIDNPMSKFSKVKSVQGTGTWNTQQGQTMYRFDYEFEDGQKLQANHTEPNNHLNVGEMAEYEVKRTHPTYGDSGSVKKPQEFPSGNTSGGGRSGGHSDNLMGVKVGHALNCASVIIAPGSGDIPQGQEKEALKYWARIIYEASNELNEEFSKITE